MRNILMLSAIATFSAVSVFAAPRNSGFSTDPVASEEVTVNSDEQDQVSHFIKNVDENGQDCGCNKPKKKK